MSDLNLATQKLLYACFIESHVAGSALEEGSEFRLTADGQTFASVGEALKTLLEKASATAQTQAFGEQRRDEVLSWIGKAASVTPEELDESLKSSTYLVGNTLTAADVAVYGSQHARICNAKQEELVKTPNLTRHFDLIQNSPIVSAVIASKHLFQPELVKIDLDDVPAIERKAEVKKEKKPKDVATGTTAKEGAAAESTVKASKKSTKVKDSEQQSVENGATKPENKPEGKKPKKEKEKAPTANAPVNTPADNKPMPHMIDLRVGKIIDVKRHPDADSLYVEQIDIGEESGPRTVVSGLVNYIPIEEMQGRTLICVCNLRPAAMRGIKSFAMVLAASSKEGKTGGVELVDPPEGSKPGDRVYFEGFENEQPVEQLNPKKKIFETIQPNFTTLDTREAAWIDPSDSKVYRIRTAGGVAKAPTFVNASLS